ncbi:hypothetical protein BJF78_09820 [Pseudonocardia sp. CNS-139]|nr:hypothetical protein BJF78_09820 [Pseudonocardia sp. CNS-139]
MPRTVLAVLAAAAVLAGGAALAAPALAQSPRDVAACHDGTCTLTVTGPVEIPLDGRAGVGVLNIVDVGPGSVTFTTRRGPGVGLVTVAENGSTRFGNNRATLTVHVGEVTGGTARVALRTAARR